MGCCCGKICTCDRDINKISRGQSKLSKVSSKNSVVGYDADSFSSGLTEGIFAQNIYDSVTGIKRLLSNLSEGVSECVSEFSSASTEVSNTRSDFVSEDRRHHEELARRRKRRR